MILTSLFFNYGSLTSLYLFLSPFLPCKSSVFQIALICLCLIFSFLRLKNLFNLCLGLFHILYGYRQDRLHKLFTKHHQYY